MAARPFGGFVLQRKFDCVLDTARLRAHGFSGFEDTCRMPGRQFAQLQARRTVPRFPTGAAA